MPFLACVILLNLISISQHMSMAFSSTRNNPKSSLPKKRVALVTGSNKGIGKEIARKLGKEENTYTILGCRDEALGRAAVEELTKDGCTDISYVKVDLHNDDESIASAVQYIQQEYGQCDVLVNNAAVCFNDPTLYGKVSHTPFEKQARITVETNFFGTLSLTKALLPMLRNSPSPRIINIASSAGRLSILPSTQRQQDFSSDTLTMDELEGYMTQFISNVEDGVHVENGWPNTCYGASKVAIIAMTKILARDEPSMMVNSVDPGYCATDQNNNQGYIPAERGAVTPYLLSTLPDEQFFSAVHWYQEQEIQW